MWYLLLFLIILTGGVILARKIKVPTKEQKQINVLQKDQEVISETMDYTVQDVEYVAETVVLNAEDLAVTAETVNLLVDIIATQEERIQALENQINGGNA